LASAFASLDKSIAEANKHVKSLLDKLPTDIQRIDKSVKKTLDVVEKDFEDLSDAVVGHSIVTEMIDKINAEFD